jgi:hypothetical protein
VCLSKTSLDPPRTMIVRTLHAGLSA